MLNFVMMIIGPLISSFIVIVLATFMAISMDFLLPAFKKWTRIFVLFIVLTVALEPVFDHFTFIGQITFSISSLFIGIYPILTAVILAAGGTFNLLNFQPAMLLFANGSIYLANHLLIPALLGALVLDIASRFLPEVSFKRLSELIRTTLLGVVSAIVAGYSVFITVGGAMSWALSGITSEPIKELVQQNIPVIGSFMTESISSMGRYSSGVTVFVGGWFMLAIWTVALVPSLKTLITALFYKWMAAFLEPFADEQMTGFLDDIGKTLFVLCAISFLIAFAFIYTTLFVVILVKLLTMTK